MKFEDFKKGLDVCKMMMDAVVSISDWRARRRTERRKALDDEKDRRIKELEKELAALKGKNGTANLVTTTAASTEPAGELHPDDSDSSDGDSDCDDEEGESDEE